MNDVRRVTCHHPILRVRKRPFSFVAAARPMRFTFLRDAQRCCGVFQATARTVAVARARTSGQREDIRMR